MAESKKLTDCYWYLQNQCIKGDACEYRHNEATIENTTVCKFWLEGKCTNENCRFRHPSGVGVHTTTKASCFYFSLGKCTKGDNCPFLHTLTTDTIPPQPTKDLALEKKKKQEEEELRKLQAETKKEEERLAQLKAEREKLERLNKRKNEQRNTQEIGRKAASAGFGTFVKSFDEIVKERKKEKAQTDSNKQKVFLTQKKVKMEELNNMETVTKTKKTDKPIKKTEKPTKKTEKPIKNIEKLIKNDPEMLAKKNNAQKGKDKPQKTETPSSGPVTFGIKTLDQIMKEKEVATNNEQEVSTTSKDEVISTQKITPVPSHLEDLRKKNQQKFGVSSVPTKTEQTSSNLDLSPKRKLTEEPKTEIQIDSKRPKTEKSKASVTPTQKVVPILIPKAATIVPTQKASPATPKAIKKSASVSDLDDFDKELADLGMEISSTTTNASSVDVEGDFDKEFNELENLMST